MSGTKPDTMRSLKEKRFQSSIDLAQRGTASEVPMKGLPGVMAAGLFVLLFFGCATHHPYTVEEYRTHYDKPIVSPGVQFAALPPAVQNTIRAEAGSADIEDIVKDDSLSHIIYHVYFQNSNLFQPLNIASDGTLLDPDLIVAIGAPHDQPGVLTGSAVAGATLNDLPPAAVKIIQRTAPDAQVESIARQVSGNQITYFVTFKDRMHPPLQVTGDGTIVAEPTK
jgi:hypothetical protein